MSKLAHSDDVSMLIIEAAFDHNLSIKTNHVRPPIPTNMFDWSAIDDSTYDGEGSPIGYGATEADAIRDLLEKLDLAP